jgi:hypothetical protein
MKAVLLTVVGVFALATAAPASAQLESEQVDGNQRICTYRNAGGGTRATVRRVGLGQPCPAFPNSPRPALEAPPTARLEATRLKDGQRVCEYAQLGRVWVVTLPVSKSCPLSAGMVQTDE